MNYRYLFWSAIIILLIVFYFFLKARKNIWVVRIPKLFSTGKISLGDFFGHLYGLMGLIGLAITIVGLVTSYNKINNEDTQYVINTLSISFVLLLVSYIIASAYYVTKVSKLNQYKSQVQIIETDLKKQYIVNRYQSELVHSVTHYLRNINARLFEFTQDKEAYSESDVEDLKIRFHDFLVILTSNLQSYFSFVTQDNCAVTIKQIDNDKKHVKTFFRDPTNFNKRKKSDIGLKENGGKYKILENTAFRIITDPHLRNNFFYDDNLYDLAENGFYENSNPYWSKLYNATIVVPISILLKTDVRDIIGFITIDNTKGELANDSNKEFLFGIADLLYNLFLRYSNFITFVESKNHKL